VPVALLGIHIDPSGNHDLIGSGMIAITAIIAAIIAARTANRRQAAQLAHDRELQSKLQTERLAYDREQRNRQHIRDTIDDALRGVDDAIRTIAEFEARIVVEDGQRSARRKIVDGEAAASPAQLEEATQALRAEIDALDADSVAVADMLIKLAFQNTRLAIRLGGNHAITTGLQELRQSYSARNSALQGLYKRSLTDKDRLDAKSKADSFNDAVIPFFKACRAWFESS
jgi:hypothetical protein